MCVRASFNFFDAHRELECNQDPVSIFILYPNHFWKAITRRSKLIWLYQFHSISATPSVQINIVWVSVAMTAMCCSQTWVNGHSLHQGTPYVNRFRSQLLHLRTEGHQTRGYRGSYKAPFTVPRFLGFFERNHLDSTAGWEVFLCIWFILAVKKHDGNSRIRHCINLFERFI